MNDGVIRNFSQLVAVTEEGQLNEDLDRATTDLVAILNEAAGSKNGKAKGSITVKLDLTLSGSVLSISSDFNVKKPKVTRAQTVFWITPDNKLSRRNPKQHELPLRDVSAPSDVRSI